jgi:hypothetical protein
MLAALGGFAMSCGTGEDPSQGGSIVVVPLAVTSNAGYTQAFALGPVADYAAWGGTFVRLRFDGSGASFGGTFANGEGTLDFGVDPNDGSVWWTGAANGGCDGAGQTIGLWTSSDASFLASAAASPVAQSCVATGTTTSSGGGVGVFGIAVDTRWVILAVGSVPQEISANVGSPDEPQWPGPTPLLTPGSSASLLRFDRQNPSTPMASLGGVTRVADAVTFHLLAQNTAEVYWLDASGTGDDRVMRATKEPWTSGQVLGTAQAGTLTGLAADDDYAVWTVSGPPTEGATGCTVFASRADGAPVRIYDGHAASFLCWGAAVDSTYAYFTTTQVDQFQDNSTSSQVSMEGVGIGRVPLAGGPPQFVSLASPRWYGPRRLKVDSGYVYAIDPSFVARIDKSAFGS